MHKHMNRTIPIKFTIYCLLILGILALVTACGSASSTSASPPSSTATSNPAPPTATSSGYGRYGNGGSNTTPTTTTAPTGATQAVTITTDSSGQFTFSPKTLTISVGSTVTWKNTTQTPHTVTSDDGKSFNSGDSTPVAPSTTFSFKFSHAGTFAYHCDFHPSMMATIVVK